MIGIEKFDMFLRFFKKTIYLEVHSHKYTI